MKIVNIGAGNAGVTLTADFILAGLEEITLYELPQYRENLDPILKVGGIMLTGEARYTGIAEISKDQITTDISEAMESADVIIVHTWANAHELVAKLMAPHLEEEQIIHICPSNLGELVFAKTFAEVGVKERVYISGQPSGWYSTRKIGPQDTPLYEVFGPPYGWEKLPGVKLSAFPAVDTEHVIRKLNEATGCFWESANNVLELILNNINIWGHPSPVIGCTGEIEWAQEKNEPYYMYEVLNHSPSLQRCQNAAAKEKSILLKKMGLDEYTPWKPWIKPVYLPEHFLKTWGPPSMKYRYIAEDIPIGCVFMSSLGSMIGVPTPFTDALITMANVINQTDYLLVPEARTVEKLGIAGMTVEELNKFLIEGTFNN
jgi:opine dehydrogenase